MASKRNIRRKTCGKKHRFPTEAEAERERRVWGRNEITSSLHPYPCTYCGGWHLGHQKKFLDAPHGAKYQPVYY